MTKLRVVIADDERPARHFLLDLLRSYDDVEVVGEAATGAEALAMIESLRPDLALLDLQMPELDGLAVVRMLKRDVVPLVAFITAYDEYALHAFDIAAIDYILKPVEPARLRSTINRAIERAERADLDPSEVTRLRLAMAEAGGTIPSSEDYLRRIPVRRRDDIIILALDQIASFVAEAEYIHIATSTGERHTITYALKELEKRLNPSLFVRLSRGAIVNISMVRKVAPASGGTYMVTLTNGQEIPVSRMRSRAVRDQLLRL